VRIKVLFFGQLKDIAGKAEDALEAPEAWSVGDVFEHYASALPRMRALAGSIVMARNQQFSGTKDLLEPGDEIAFLPPVSGGSAEQYSHLIEHAAGHFFALTRETISIPHLKQRLLRGEDGAIVDFEGVVRNNTKGRATRFLDYECYEGMAVKMMEQIGTEIAGQHAIGRIAMVHRLGRMEIGETSVAIVVTSPHRRPAFEAALEGINRLKKLVPIWKKEHFADGEVWVDGEWDESVLPR
jgi:molybdopterin synthase catalytic subunit/molybdopterin converting factor small subunit